MIKLRLYHSAPNGSTYLYVFPGTFHITEYINRDEGEIQTHIQIQGTSYRIHESVTQIIQLLTEETLEGNA